MSDQSSKNPVPTGRRYSSVEDLMKGEGFSPEIQEGVKKLSDTTRVSRTLAALRARAGLTQQEMAQRLEKTQGYVSKLEAGTDETIKLGEIMEYARVLNEPIGFLFGPQIDHVKAIKLHAFAMRERMMALAKIACQDEQLEQEIQKFYGEAFLNIFAHLAECQAQLPNGSRHVEFKIEVIPPVNMATSERSCAALPA